MQSCCRVGWKFWDFFQTKLGSPHGNDFVYQIPAILHNLLAHFRDLIIKFPQHVHTSPSGGGKKEPEQVRERRVRALTQSSPSRNQKSFSFTEIKELWTEQNSRDDDGPESSHSHLPSLHTQKHLNTVHTALTRGLARSKHCFSLTFGRLGLALKFLFRLGR